MKIKTDSLLKLTLVFFISVLSFAVGTFVGKQYSDAQHKIASMEPAKEKEDAHAERGVASHNEETPKTMTDEELAKLSAEFIADDDGQEKPAGGEHGASHDDKAAEHGATAAHGEPAAAHGEKSVATHEAPKESHGAAETKAPAKNEHEKSVASHEEKVAENKPGHAVAVSEAQAMVEGKIPAEKVHAKESVREPASVPKNLAPYNIGKFTVQLASYNNEEEAKKRASELKNKGYSAFYVPADIKGKNFYRVSVGLFATEKEAKDYRKELVDKGESQSSIITQIKK